MTANCGLCSGEQPKTKTQVPSLWPLSLVALLSQSAFLSCCDAAPQFDGSGTFFILFLSLHVLLYLCSIYLQSTRRCCCSLGHTVTHRHSLSLSGKCDVGSESCRWLEAIMSIVSVWEGVPPPFSLCLCLTWTLNSSLNTQVSDQLFSLSDLIFCFLLFPVKRCVWVQLGAL